MDFSSEATLPISTTIQVRTHSWSIQIRVHSVNDRERGGGDLKEIKLEVEVGDDLGGVGEGKI